MISQFFYLPANQKVDEEKRIAFTQERIKTVKDFLSEHFLSARYKNGNPYVYDNKEWYVHVGESVIINLNYWNEKIDEFQSKNRCKIEQIDYLYLLTQLWRDVNGRKISLADGTLSIGLCLPKKRIAKKKEETMISEPIQVTISPKKFRIVKHEHLLDNGKVYVDYRPQKKSWIFWHDFFTGDPEFTGVIGFKTEAEAKKFLVDYIRLNGFIGETVISPAN